MNAFATMKRLVEIGLPAKWLVPVMEAFENPEGAAPVRKKRKRRTREEMARDAVKTKKVKVKRKKAAPPA